MSGSRGRAVIELVACRVPCALLSPRRVWAPGDELVSCAGTMGSSPEAQPIDPATARWTLLTGMPKPSELAKRCTPKIRGSIAPPPADEPPAPLAQAVPPAAAPPTAAPPAAAAVAAAAELATPVATESPTESPTETTNVVATAALTSSTTSLSALVRMTPSALRAGASGDGGGEVGSGGKDGGVAGAGGMLGDAGGAFGGGGLLGEAGGLLGDGGGGGLLGEAGGLLGNADGGGMLGEAGGLFEVGGPASAEMISRVAALMARVAEVMLWMAAQTVATRALWGIQCSRRQPTEHYCWIQWIGFLAHRNQCSRSRGGKC